jgi:signal transduction histidine kinase
MNIGDFPETLGDVRVGARLLSRLGPRWATWPLVLAATALGVYGASVFRGVGHTWFEVTVDLLPGWGFVAVGLIAWRRQPENRTAHLMVAEGLTWFLPNLEGSAVPVLMGLGVWLASLNEAVMVHLVFAFPTGRLASRTHRAVVAAAYLLALGGGLLYLGSDGIPNDPFRCSGCSTGPVMIGDSSLLGGAQSVAQGAGTALALCVMVMLIGGWMRSTSVRRRLLTPVWLSSGAVLLMMLFHGLDAADMLLPADGVRVLAVFANLGFLALPVGFGVVSLRLRMARAAVGERLLGLGSDLSTPALGEALAKAVGDPSLELLLWDEEAGEYGNRAGSRALPGTDDRATARIDDRDGRPRAIIMHDPALAGEADLLGAVVAAASLGLERDWHRRQLAASATRLLETSLAERRKVERDLHDGAQQRLLALAARLALAQKAAPDAPAAAAIDDARRELRLALEELRSLANGIHPGVLSQSGLGPALEEVAERLPLAIEVQVPSRRFEGAVETTAYFVACEALANAVKHARASRASVRACLTADALHVEIADDGVGGADPARGRGLAGLTDRVRALGGDLTVVSPPGAGTRVIARLPSE